MKKANAIKILTEQKNKLQDDQEIETWIRTTSEKLRRIFPNTHISKIESLEDIDFFPYESSDSYTDRMYMKEGKDKASKYIEEFINDINNFELEKDKEDHQFISLIKNKFLYIIFVPTVTGAFYLGKEIGQVQFDQEKISLEKEKNTLEIELEKKTNEITKLKKRVLLLKNQ